MKSNLSIDLHHREVVITVAEIVNRSEENMLIKDEDGQQHYLHCNDFLSSWTSIEVGSTIKVGIVERMNTTLPPILQTVN